MINNISKICDEDKMKIIKVYNYTITALNSFINNLK